MRLICWFKGHDPEPISATGPMVIPGSGVFVHYVPDPVGEDRGCRRCGLAPLGRGEEIR